jgi:MarR family multiple gene transcriptional regulator MgrA
MSNNIEKLISQKAFNDEYHKGLVSLIFVGNWIESRHQQFFKKFDITMQQFNILRILRGQHPQTANINTLKERMLDKMSDVSRLVERLRKAELVERKNCESDRRAVDVKITNKGLQLLKTIDDEMEILNKCVKALSEKEITQLNKLLDKMLDNY